MRNLLMAAVGCTLLSGQVLADDCEYEKTVRLDLQAAGELDIDVGSGFLKVRGVDGADRVSAVGRACASSAGLLEGLDLEQRGSNRLEAVYPDQSGWSFGKRYARIDLEIEVPTSLAVKIDDGSGSIFVERVAGVTIDDGSGSIELFDIRGDVRIEDGSGSIDAELITGNVYLDDGSGEIEVRSVERNVIVEEDGSGSMTLVGIGGDVTVEEDGSGSITVRDVGGSVTVDRDGSGSISVKQVAGDFKVGNDGSGGINYAQVMGKVDLPRDDHERRLK